MIRNLSVSAMLCGAFLVGHGQNLKVNGNASASWRAPTLISQASDAIVHPGDGITISVRGQIDINYEERHKSHCSAFIFCHDETIPIHNFRTPGQSPIVVQVRQQGGGAVLATAVVGSSPATLALPLSEVDFTNHYEIVASLEGLNTSVDPARSYGSYDVEIEVDAGPRAAYFRSWLSLTHPTAVSATSSDAIGEDLRRQGTTVAAALRQYAVLAFPVPGGENNDSHAKLVRKAVELAPGDAENTLALSRYLRAIGQDAQADAELNKSISDLQSLNDPHSRRQLGDAYMMRMAVALSKGGGLEQTASQAALSFADSAVKAYKDAQRPDLVSGANYSRGRILRGMRTKESLSASVASFNEALAAVPDSRMAESVVATVSGKLFAVRSVGQMRLSSLDAEPIAKDPLLTSWPVAWDPWSQRLLVVDSGLLSWLPPLLAPATAAPAIGPGEFTVADGAILWLKERTIANYFANDGNATAVLLGGAGKEQCTGPQGGLVQSVSLSNEGTDLAVVCDRTVRAFKYSKGKLSLSFEKPIADPTVSNIVVAGPTTCGTVLISPPFPGRQTWKLSLLRAQDELKILEIPVPGPSLSAAPIITSDQVAFDGSLIYVITGPMEISSFSCANANAAGTLALPKVDSQPYDRGSFQWISKGQLGVLRGWARSVDVITWPNRGVTHFIANESFSLEDILDQSNIVLPPLVPTGAPRMFHRQRRVELKELFSGNKSDTIRMNVPGLGQSIVPTAEGSHFLVQQIDSPTWISDNAPNAAATKGSTDEVAIDVMSSGAKWISAKRGISSLAALRIIDADGTGRDLTFPAAPDSFMPKVIEALKRAYGEWKALPTGPEVIGKFRNRDLPDLYSDTRLISLGYQVTSGGLHREASSGVLPPLSAARGIGAFTICGSPQGKPLLNAEPLQIAQLLPVVLFMGTEGSNTISFQEVPDAMITPPTQPAAVPSTCSVGVIVRGPTPTLLVRLEVGGRKLRMLRQGGWVTVEIPEQVVAGWTTPAGGMLLLIELNAVPNQSTKYSLKRVNPDGSTEAACATCGELKLLEAFNTLVPPPSNMDSSAIQRFRAAGPPLMIMVDEKGLCVALPADDETLVVSLTDGKVLAHAPLGVPQFVDEHRLVLSVGNGRLTSYSF